MKDTPCDGEPSLQNSLERAMNGLKNMPAHSSREVLVLFGSLTTCDPGDIQKTIKSLKENNIEKCQPGYEQPADNVFLNQVSVA